MAVAALALARVLGVAAGLSKVWPSRARAGTRLGGSLPLIAPFSTQTAAARVPSTTTLFLPHISDGFLSLLFLTKRKSLLSGAFRPTPIDIMALKASDPNVVHQATTRRGKRRRSKSPAPPPNKRKTVDKTKAAPPSRTRNLKAVPLLNPLPSPPTHARPSSRLFFWGSGDSGQLGMGDHFLDTTITKPRRNTYMEQQAEAGAFGGPGAGLESVAAGSLHSAVIDENGTVGFTPNIQSNIPLRINQIWTFGAYDNAELGRKTIEKVDGSKSVEVDEATSIPFYLPVPIQCLIDEGFRAVNVVLGDCIGVALGIDGQLRAWGTYRVSSSGLS